MRYADPAQWDYLWSTGKPDQLRAQLLGLSVEWDSQDAVTRDARIVQCMIGLRQSDEALDYADDALARWQGRAGVDVALLRAMRMLVLMDLRDSDEVLRASLLIQGTSPSRMEAAVFSYFATGTAHAVNGEPETALLHVARAEAVAQLLGMTHRLRVIRLELARLRLQAGQLVEAEPVLDDADTSHPATSAWGAMVAMLALAARGELVRSAGYAVSRGLKEAPLICAMAGAPVPTEGDAWCLSAAQAIAAATQRRYDLMPVLTVGVTPAMQYGPFLNGLRAVCGYSSLPNVDVALGPRPSRVDLRVLWNMVRLTAALRGLGSGNASVIVAEILDDLRRLPMGCELVGFIQRLLPHQALLLTYAPGAASVPALSCVSVPLLCGDTVRGPVRMDMHRPTGDMLIARALGESRHVNTGLVSKARGKLRAVGVDMDGLVTVGHLHVWLTAITQSAAGTPAAEGWHAAHAALLDGSPRLRWVLSGRIEETSKA